jgi:hypothetical protein
VPAGTRFGRDPLAVHVVVEEQLMPINTSELLLLTNRVAFGVMLKPVPVIVSGTAWGPTPPYPGVIFVIVGCASAGAAHKIIDSIARNFKNNFTNFSSYPIPKRHGYRGT